MSGTVSIGEADALSDDYALAYYKSQEAAGSFLPNEGAVLISLSDKTNLCDQAIEIGKEFQKLGFNIYATEGTAKFYEKEGVKCEVVNKIAEGRPNVLDIILNKQVNLIINTPWAKRDAIKDDKCQGRVKQDCLQAYFRTQHLGAEGSKVPSARPPSKVCKVSVAQKCLDFCMTEPKLRTRSVNYKVPYSTTLAGAYNTVKGIAAARNGHGAVKSLQEYHASIEEV